MNICGTYGPSVAMSHPNSSTRSKRFSWTPICRIQFVSNLLMYRKRQLLLLPHQVRPTQPRFSHLSPDKKKAIFRPHDDDATNALLRGLQSGKPHGMVPMVVYGKFTTIPVAVESNGEASLHWRAPITNIDSEHSDVISQTVELYVHRLPAYLRHH